MHPPILEVRGRLARASALAARGVLGLALAAAAVAASAAPGRPGLAADCPAAAQAVVEHFIGADCLACWQAAPDGPVPGAQAVGAGEWSLDWLVPAADDAAMAPSAIPESAERLARLGPYLPARLQAQPAAFDTSTPLAPQRADRRFWVHSSLPHEGYFGVQMHASGTWPEGSTGWIALYEQIPAGVRDTRIARRLVRVLVGPLKLPDAPGKAHAVAPLYGLRWPLNAHVEKLVAAGWVEDAQGRITQIATDRCADPR
ncbi:MAG: hypothetical protein ACTHL8_22320 [Burkholderiaceae bacterium]